jgi:hypothetical protein
MSTATLHKIGKKKTFWTTGTSHGAAKEHAG